MVAFFANIFLGLAVAGYLADARPATLEPRPEWKPPAHPKDPFMSKLDNNLYYSTLSIDMDYNKYTYSGGPGHMLVTVDSSGHDSLDEYPAQIMCRMRLHCDQHNNPDSDGWVTYNEGGREIPCLGEHTLRIKAGNFCKPKSSDPFRRNDAVFWYMEIEYEHGKGKQLINDVNSQCKGTNGDVKFGDEASTQCQFGTFLKAWNKEDGFEGEHGHSA